MRRVSETPEPTTGGSRSQDLTYGALWKTSEAILDGNWQYDHTVPSRTLYPHQWSWDAAFIAVGLAHTAPHRAWHDLRSLFNAQWADGRVPHIVFDPDVSERDYFPGPAFWQVSEAHSTGIVQPPVHALAAWLIHQASPDLDQLRWLYPRLVAQQDYLAKHRDVGGSGLVSIVHPWESGLDNSPAWDDALRNVPADEQILRRYQRRDTAVSVVSHRPTNTDYARYIGLASSYRDLDYSDSELAERYAFVVECPAFNALYIGAERALADIAAAIGADPTPHLHRAAELTRILAGRLYDPASGMYHALDVLTGRRGTARCISGLIPLTLPELPAEHLATLITHLTSRQFAGAGFALPVPSYDRTAPDFDGLRYWRGPIWINMNWLLWRGLRQHHQGELAATLRTSMLELINRSGSYEYFEPDTGQGIGTPEFSWTAALALDLLAAP